MRTWSHEQHTHFHLIITPLLSSCVPQYFIKIARYYAKTSALKSLQFIKKSSKYRRNQVRI